MEVIFVILILVFTLIIGVPIPFCFGSAFIYLTYSTGFQTDFLLSTGYSNVNSIVLLAIPLFIMSGGIMEKGQIGDSLVGVVEMFTGKAKAGLGNVAVITCAIFGSISGSAAATLSCIGSIMFPKMKEKNYPPGYSAALISCAAPLGLLIPPSSAQILYAWSGNQSVLACFLSTVIPGIILTILLCITNFFLTSKMPINTDTQINKELWPRELGKKSVKALPSLLMPVIVLGGIYGGIMTPTEAAAVGVAYAIPVGMYVYKKIKFEDLKSIMIETATTTGVVMVMFFMVSILSRLFVMENIPTKIADVLLGITDNKTLILLSINIFMVIIGMLMDDVSGILLCTPILLPIVTKLGVHPIQFAAILGVNLGMGNITPPTAPILYLGGRVGKANIGEMIKPTLILIIFAYIPTLLITTYIPQISLTLPKLFLPKLFM